MRLRKVLTLFLCALAVTVASAQTVNLTASNIKTLAGATFTGKLCMVPANNTGAVVSFQYGGGGLGVTQQVCWPVTAGALQSAVTVPDTYQTIPQNLCLYTQLIDPTQPLQRRVVGSLPCLQPASSGQSWCSGSGSSTVCDLDNYIPASTPLTLVVAGPAGPTFNGGSVSNPIILPADPVLESQAATKNYSDLHGGAVVNATQEYGCVPLTSAEYAIQKASGIWIDLHGTTACLQSAINASCNGSSYAYKPRLMLEPGVYVVGNSTTEGLSENSCVVDLRGNGRAAALIQHATGALVENASGTPYTVTVAGAWNPSTAYSVNQMVSRQSLSYVATAANTNTDPWTDGGAHWVHVYSRVLHIANLPVGTMDLMQGGLWDLAIGGTSTTTALLSSDANLDVPFTISGAQFSGSATGIENAIEAPTWLNFHVDHSRFDYIGGYAAAFQGMPSAVASNPQDLKAAFDFVDDTYDNGSGQASHGNGVLFVNETSASSGTNPPTVPSGLAPIYWNSGTVNWLNGRIELNQPLNTYATAAGNMQRSLFRVLQTGFTGTSPLVTVALDGSPIAGYASHQYNSKIVSSDAGEVGFESTASSFQGFNELNNNDAGTGFEAIPVRLNNSYVLNHTSPYAGQYSTFHFIDQLLGINLTATTTSQLSSFSGWLTTGSLVFNKTGIAGTANSALYQANCPTSGAGETSVLNTLTPTATIAAGSTALTLSGAPSDWIAPQFGVDVVGAGASGADLYANILHVDDTGLILTLDTAATTAVSGAIVKNTVCTLSPVSPMENLNTQTFDVQFAIGANTGTNAIPITVNLSSLSNYSQFGVSFKATLSSQYPARTVLGYDGSGTQGGMLLWQTDTVPDINQQNYQYMYLTTPVTAAGQFTIYIVNTDPTYARQGVVHLQFFTYDTNYSQKQVVSVTAGTPVALSSVTPTPVQAPWQTLGPTTTNTPTTGDNSKSLATTAFVQNTLANNGGSTTLCSFPAESSAVTGTTAETNVDNCAVPAGMMGTKARIEIHANVVGGSSNTGSCTLRLRWGTASGSTSATQIGGVATSTGASKLAYLDQKLLNAGSTSSQVTPYWGYGNGALTTSVGSTATINTSTATGYVIVNLVNSVSGDSCYVYDLDAELWPQG